ncbi:MAG: GNAT family N-acetyltransferase [Bacteroidota bacterium]|nr:GNAT family N-acetyltransferase [Bacteroidota bacterium]
MKFFESNCLNTEIKITLYELWNKEYPIQVRFNYFIEFENYINKLTSPKHIIISNNNGEIIGWAVEFAEDNELWLNLIIKQNFQKKGYGSILLNKLKENKASISAWVVEHNNYKLINGKTYPSPKEFYLKNNFTLLYGIKLNDETISAVKMIWHKNP